MIRAVFALALAGCAADPVARHEALAAAFTDGSYNGRGYKLYTPSGYSGAAIPLVVMLHGCAQDPADFAAGTRMNDLAEAKTFFVVYPEQSSGENAQQCWNWFESGNQARGAGEPADIVGIVDQVAGSVQVDAAKVYAAGLSAGAAMAVILGATYPDRFPAIAAGSGLEYKAASSVSGAFAAMGSGGPSPSTQGMAAYAAMGAQARTVRVLVMQGTADTTVAPVNGDQVLSQWAEADDLASDGHDDDNLTDTPKETVAGMVAGGHAYTISSYVDQSGSVVLQKLVVTGMDHAWSGGNATGSFTDAKGPDATQLVWDFFAGKSLVDVLDGGVALDLAMPPAQDASAASDLANGIDAKTATGDMGSGCAVGGRPSASAPLALLLGLLFLVGRRRVGCPR
jgi:poly(hydroxyalkanoate) depolymerase family esterase